MAVDSSVVKKTQESLGKIIKKPPLTEKLLTKPPFRYLHDIISEVTKASGFLEGLYSGDELTSAAIKDKDAKIAYLQKAIDAVGFALDGPVSVRPSKIIAGQEPDKTNEFLQSLGKAAAKGKNADAVEKVKKGEKPAKKSKSEDKGRSKEKEVKEGKERRSSKDKADDKSKERDSSKGRGREKESKDSSKERVNASKSKERSGRDRKSRDDSKTRDSAGSKERRKPEEKKEEKKVEEKKDPEAAKKEERKRRKEKKEEAEPVVMQPEPEPEPVAEAADPEQADTPTTNGFHEQEEGEGSPPPVRIPRPSSAKGQRRRPKEESEDAPPARPTSERPRRNKSSRKPHRTGHHDDHGYVERKTYAEAVTAATTAGPPVPITQGKRRERPTSARPAPPKIKKQDDEPEDLTVRQHSGRPPAGIIVDNEKAPEDDDMFINEETEELPMAMARSAAPVADDGQHGGLVQKILETQKNYATEDEQKNLKKQRAPLMNQAARQKERGLVKKEIDTLKVGIQTLASSAAPLGKILDYMQEDLDSMQKELETWRSENKYHDTAIHAEESHMEKTLEPLRDQLSEIDHHFNDQINKINAMKSNIAHNDEKIEQMLSTMSFTAT